MKKYTINQFREEFPNDDACLHRIYELRFKGLVCPTCNSEKPFNRVKDRRAYQCPGCGFQLYPTSGTVFEKTTIPLSNWFFAIFLQTTTRNGVAAKELERQMDICYKTALRMSHQIRKLMSNQSTEPFTGVVEIDETIIGKGHSNAGSYSYGRNNKKELKAKGTYKEAPKVSVFGMLQRGGNINVRVVEDLKLDTLQPIISEMVVSGSTVYTDESKLYQSLHKRFDHDTVHHTANEFVRGNVHTNGIESFWSQLKRTIDGTHIHVSKKHLQKYIDEVAFRYMYRGKQQEMFNAILNRVAS